MGLCSKVHQMAPVGNGWVDCVIAERYRYVKLQLHSGHVHYQVGIVPSGKHGKEQGSQLLKRQPEVLESPK